MHFFKTEALIPQTLLFSDRPHFRRAAPRYGNARLRRDDRIAAVDASAPARIELPRVQAVVDAIIYAHAA